MTAFQPTQGPGSGLKLATVSTRITNDSTARLKGRCAQLITDTSGVPYALANGVAAADAKTAQLAVYAQDAAASETDVPVVVEGICEVLLGANVLVDAFLMVNTSGLFLTATTGLAVRARALEAGSNGDRILADFSGRLTMGDAT